MTDCPALALDNNSVLSTTDQFVSAHVNVSCRDGFQLMDGTEFMELDCQTDGTWSRDYSQNPCVEGFCLHSCGSESV